MNDPVTWFLRVLMIAAAVMNIWSCVRNWYLGNKYDLSRTINECIQDDEGKVSFAKWMTIHHPYERVEHTDLIRMYMRWSLERDLPVMTRLVNDRFLIDMLINTLDNTEGTPT